MSGASTVSGLHGGRRQSVRAKQIDLAADLFRQVGQVDSHLLSEARQHVLDRPDRLEHLATLSHLLRKPRDGRFTHEPDIAKRMRRGPGIDNVDSRLLGAADLVA